MADTHLERLSTGVPGLGKVLHGGFIPRRTYLVRGGPGTGKSTLGLQYLLAGAQAGERCLLISLKENETEIRANAAALGFDLAGKVGAPLYGLRGILTGLPEISEAERIAERREG